MKILALAAKHKLALGAAAVLAYVLWRRRRAAVKCVYADSVIRDGKCYRTGTVTPLFDQLDASDATVAFDDNGMPLITRPSQLL